MRLPCIVQYRRVARESGEPTRLINGTSQERQDRTRTSQAVRRTIPVKNINAGVTERHLTQFGNPEVVPDNIQRSRATIWRHRCRASRQFRFCFLILVVGSPCACIQSEGNLKVAYMSKHTTMPDS